MAKFLVKSGASIEAEDYQGRTPLAVACKKGDLKLTTFLLKQGASLQCVDKEGNTILDLALRSRTKVFNKIAPLYLNSPASKQLTPLKKLDLYYQAARNKQYKLANKFLRMFDIDIYTLNANGETLLFRTILTDYILLELVQWLMDQGLAATINHRNNDGNTFLHYLAESGDENNTILKLLLESHIEQVSDLADPQEAINILELLISLPNQEIDDFIYKYPSKSAFFIRQVLLEDGRSHWGIDTEKLCYDEQHRMFAIQIPSAFSQVHTGMLRQYAVQPGDIKLATFKLINAKIEEIKATIAAREQAEKQLRDRATKAEQQLQDFMAASNKQLQALKAEYEKRLQDLRADNKKIIHDLQQENSNLDNDVAAAVVALDREVIRNDTSIKQSETNPSNTSQNQELHPPTQPRSFSPLREHSLFRAARSLDGSQSGNGSDGNSARRVNSENNFPSRGTSANSSPVRISPDDESCASPLSVSSDDDASSSAHVSLTCVSSVIELPNSESSAINFSPNCPVNQEDDATPKTETTDERRVAP